MMFSDHVRSAMYGNPLFEGVAQFLSAPVHTIRQSSFVRDVNRTPIVRQNIRDFAAQHAVIDPVVKAFAWEVKALRDAGGRETRRQIDTGKRWMATHQAVTQGLQQAKDEYRGIMGRHVKRGVATAAAIGAVGTALHVYRKLRKKSKEMDPQYRQYNVYPEYGYAAVGRGPEVSPEFSNMDQY